MKKQTKMKTKQKFNPIIQKIKIKRLYLNQALIMKILQHNRKITRKLNPPQHMYNKKPNKKRKQRINPINSKIQRNLKNQTRINNTQIHPKSQKKNNKKKKKNKKKTNLESKSNHNLKKKIRNSCQSLTRDSCY